MTISRKNKKKKRSPSSMESRARQKTNRLKNEQKLAQERDREEMKRITRLMGVPEIEAIYFIPTK